MRDGKKKKRWIDGFYFHFLLRNERIKFSLNNIYRMRERKKKGRNEERSIGQLFFQNYYFIKVLCSGLYAKYSVRV